MSLVDGHELVQDRGPKRIFAGVSIQIHAGDRIGLVGPNGAGKTTLLQILAGVEHPSGGRLHRAARLRVGYLPQRPPKLDYPTVAEALGSALEGLRRTKRELEHLEEQMATAGGDERLMARYARLQSQFEARAGYEMDARVSKALTGLGIEADRLETPMRTLSGGQQTRVMLCRVLLDEPDLLLLDEPTNHLDLECLQWLEGWLQNYPGSYVVVSHDRYLLDRITNRIWELSFGRLDTYRGTYEDYRRQRSERVKARTRRYERQQEFVRKTEEFVRRFKAGQRHKEARGRQKRLERFLEQDAIEAPETERRIKLPMLVSPRSSEIVLETSGLVIGYERARPLATVPDLQILRGQRVAFVGPNGAGKTTLLRTLLGEVAPLDGKARLGASLRTGRLSQQQDELAAELTILEAVRAAHPQLRSQAVRAFLGSFLFTGADVFKRLGVLSGGERRRVALARVVVRGPNVLVLDEPTNGLDIPSREQLEDILELFEGTILFVSHDRYLIKKLATHVCAFRTDGVVYHKGGWEDFARLTAVPESTARCDAAPPRRDERAKPKRKGGNRRTQLEARMRGLEDRIHALESGMGQLSALISRAGEDRDLGAIHEAAQEYRVAETRLKGLLAEWERVAGMLEAFDSTG